MEISTYAALRRGKVRGSWSSGKKDVKDASAGAIDHKCSPWSFVISFPTQCKTHTREVPNRSPLHYLWLFSSAPRWSPVQPQAAGWSLHSRTATLPHALNLKPRIHTGPGDWKCLFIRTSALPSVRQLRDFLTLFFLLSGPPVLQWRSEDVWNLTWMVNFWLYFQYAAPPHPPHRS